MGLFKRQQPKATKFDGKSFIFSDFSYGLYNLETPRNISEQIASLALVDGKNIWSERGALIPQYGENFRGECLTSDNSADIPFITSIYKTQENSFYIITISGAVYYYSTLVGLKKYKTPIFENNLSEDIVIGNAKNQLYLYDSSQCFLYGDVYNDNSTSSTGFVLIQSDLTARTIGNITSVSTVANDNIQYLWVGKKIVGKTTDSKYISGEITSIQDIEDEYGDTIGYQVEILFSSGDSVVDGTISLGEKTLHTLNYGENFENPEFYWKYEDSAITQQDIVNHKLKPKLMAVALNRLWVEDYDGTVYYSAVGNFASFDQANGAGFFKGFYKDNSKLLSIEEFYSGVLLTKETGMYHVKLSTKDYSYSNSGVTIAQSSSDNYLTVEKINNINQKFSTDHIIIGSEVIAYDNFSGNLCQACYVNYLGGVQEGAILLHGTEMNSLRNGIASSPKRVLCFSSSEEILLFYYGATLNKALVIPRNLSMYPRETSSNFLNCLSVGNGIVGVKIEGQVVEDFARDTIVEGSTFKADFEPIGLRGNKLLCGATVEVTELHGVTFDIGVDNDGTSNQSITPPRTTTTSKKDYPYYIYSDYSKNYNPSSYVYQSLWAEKRSSLVRLSAPLSGREGLSISLEFKENIPFCLLSLNFPDLSLGE